MGPHSASSSSSKPPQKRFSQFVAPAASAPGKQFSGCSSVFGFLSRLQGGSLLCNLPSLLRKVIDFQFVCFFFFFYVACKDSSDEFQALYVLELNLKSCSLFIFIFCPECITVSIAGSVQLELRWVKEVGFDSQLFKLSAFLPSKQVQGQPPLACHQRVSQAGPDGLRWNLSFTNPVLWVEKPPAGLALLDACAPPCPPLSPLATPSVKARPEPLLGLPGPQVPLPSVDSSFSFSQCLSAPDVPCNTS